MKEFNLLVWLTQLGISVAVPPALCTLGAVWLRQHFDLSPWVLVGGICLGFILAIHGFRTSLKEMERMEDMRMKDKDAPPVSFNDHQ